MPPTVGPEIAVRLSAQGVQDVVNAFARVRQEGKKTGTETSSSLSIINGQLQSLTALLPPLTAATAVVALASAIEKVGAAVVSTSLEAREATENIGKLSEKSGASVGTLSALALSAHDSEVSLDDLGKGMVKLAKAQEQAADGNKDTQKAFASLGITLKDLQTLDPGDLFVKVAQKMAALPAGAERTAISLKLFGKAGADLIPMLDSLGTDGFDKAVEKAKRLGLYLDDDMVNSSRAAQDSLHELEDIAAGWATQFNAGFMPAATAGIETFAEAISGKGVTSVRDFGTAAGEAFVAIAGAVSKASIYLGAFWNKLTYDIKTVRMLIDAFQNNDKEGFDDIFNNYGDDRDDYFRNVDRKRSKDLRSVDSNMRENLIEVRQRKPNSYPTGLGADGDGTSDAEHKKALDDANKLAKAYSDLMQARADNELAIQKTANDLAEQEDKRRYDAGLESLDKYYDDRKQRIEENYDAEYRILQDKEAAAFSLPTKGNSAAESQALQDKRQQTIEGIQAQEYQLSLRRQSQLAQLEDERGKARQDLAEKQLQMEQQLSGAEGDRAAAAQAGLERELQQYRDLLVQEGQSNAAIDLAVDKYRQLAQARIQFETLSQQASSAYTSLNNDIGRIQDQAGAGAISQIAATAKILDLEKQRLPGLQAIATEMMIIGAQSQNSQMIQQAAQLQREIDKQTASLQNVKTAATELTDQLTSTGYNAVVDFFADGISGAKSFGDAMGDLANTFEKMVGKMVAQLLTFYLLEALVGWIAPDSNYAKSLAASGPFGGGKGFDSGGWTGGQRGKPAGIVHGEEFVVKAGPAAANRPMLEAMNAGLTPLSVATPSDYSTPIPAANGGDTTVAVGSPIINITTPPGTSAETKQSTGSNGQSITDIIIKTVSSSIAGGGQVAQTMQGTFGLSRRGTVRG